MGIETALKAIEAATELLARRTAAKPVVMFHGTSSGPNGSRLRSILKHGLIPTAPKAWADDPNAKQAGQRSRAAYGGTYFSANPRVAFSSVHKARGDDRSQYPVIITATIQPRAALPDEDDYTHSVDHAYHYATKTVDHPHTDGFYYLCIFLDGYKDDYLKEAKGRFAESMAAMLKQHGVTVDLPRLQKFTDPLFDAEVVRRVSNQKDDWYGFKMTVQSRALEYFKYHLETPRELSELPKELQQKPTYEEGEMRFRQALDALTRATRRLAIGLETHAEDAPERFRHVLRVMEPVTFRGRNRITSIVSLPNYYSRDTGTPVTVVSHYGDPTAVVKHLESEGYEVEVVRPGARLAASAQWADPPEYGHSDYAAKNGKLVSGRPADFLALSSPLVQDDEVAENVQDLLETMQRRPIDPPVLVLRGKKVVSHDGRHRALAAIKLGLESIPVLLLDVDGREPPDSLDGLVSQRVSAAAYTDETGRFWGSQGSGAVFLSEDTGRILVQHRSQYVNEPNTWGVIGGAIDPGEDPKEAMQREVREETGYHGPMEVEPLFMFQSGKFRYHNFLVTVPHEFDPKHGWESQGHVWTTLDDLPEPLHFGFKALLPSLKEKLQSPIMAATSPLPDFKEGEPGLMTLDEFLKLRNPGGKVHPNSAYDFDLKKLNQDFSLQQLGTAKDRFDEYRVVGNAKGVLVYKDDHLVAVIHDGVLYNEKTSKRLPAGYMSSGGDREYKDFGVKSVRLVKYPAEYVPLVSDVAKKNRETYKFLLKNILVDGQPMQVRAERNPEPNQGVGIAILNENGEVVASAQDEWGATLLVVAEEYRGKKLGQIIGKLWYHFNPDYMSGGFTPQGEDNAVRIWESRVREFMANGWYSALVKDGTLTQDRVRGITSKLPKPKAKPIAEKPKAKEKGTVLLFLDDPKEPVSFVLYDSRFLEDQDEKYILAHGFFRSSEPVGSFLFKIDYERPYAKLATYVALQMARQNNEPIYIGEGYGDLLELDGLEHVSLEGDYAALTKDVLPLAALATKEQKARKPLDPYREIQNSLLEMAESKWS